jgi:hypothetical protein
MTLYETTKLRLHTFRGCHHANASSGELQLTFKSLTVHSIVYCLIALSGVSAFFLKSRDNAFFTSRTYLDRFRFSFAVALSL